MLRLMRWTVREPDTPNSARIIESGAVRMSLPLHLRQSARSNCSHLHTRLQRKDASFAEQTVGCRDSTRLSTPSGAISHHDATKTVPGIIYQNRRPTLRPSEQV